MLTPSEERLVKAVEAFAMFWRDRRPSGVAARRIGPLGLRVLDAMEDVWDGRRHVPAEPEPARTLYPAVTDEERASGRLSRR